MTDTVVEIANLMTDIIVDAVDPMTDILVSAVSPRTDTVGRGADLMTVIIVSMTRQRHVSRSMSSSLSSSQPAWQSRPGQNYPAFPGSRVVPARQLNSKMTAYQRMLKFGSADPPKLTKNTLEIVC